MAATKGKDIFPGNQGYPRNSWYVAALSREVTSKPLARTFLDTPVVMYRTQDGRAVALHDRCPHRGLPLSMGTLVDGNVLQCGYHGIKFNVDGSCAAVPSQDSTPSIMRVQPYALVEKWNWLWIWLGDQEKADPNLIPDHHWLGLEKPGYFATDGFMLELGCNYQFMHDNLIDSTHFSYLHAGLLDSGDLVSARFWSEDEGRTLRLGREMQGVRFPPQVANYFRVDANKAYDRRMVTEACAPAIAIGKQALRDSSDSSAPTMELYAINATTPVSRRKTLLFHVQVTSFDAKWQPPELDGMKYIVVQDQIALEVIQNRFDEYGEDFEVSVKSDVSGVKLRRIIDGMIRAEEPVA